MSEAVGVVFHEAVSNIVSVRLLRLEDHFGKKFAILARDSLATGMRRAIVSGVAFGLVDSTIVFATGKASAINKI